MSLSHWEFTDEFRFEPEATMGASASGSGASASSDGGANLGPGQSGAVMCLSWCTSSFDAAMLVVGGSSLVVRVFGYSPSARRWVPMVELRGHLDSVHDVAWAPCVGRSYHLIATAGQDGRIGLWKLQAASEASTSTDSDGSALSAAEGGAAVRAPAAAPRLTAGTATAPGAVAAAAAAEAHGMNTRRLPGAAVDALAAAVFEDHHAAVWRVAWNVTGTVLASSGDDGTLRLRKQNLGGGWESIVAVDARAAATADMSAAPATHAASAAHSGAAAGMPSMVPASSYGRATASSVAPEAGLHLATGPHGHNRAASGAGGVGIPPLPSSLQMPVAAAQLHGLPFAMPGSGGTGTASHTGLPMQGLPGLSMNQLATVPGPLPFPSVAFPAAQRG